MSHPGTYLDLPDADPKGEPPGVKLYLITDRIRSTTGRLCFDTCLSICLSTPGGYPSQVQPGGTPPQIPPIRPAGGYPSCWGVPLRGGTPPRGYPTSGYPPSPSDMAGGYPCRGVPHLGYPPVRPGWGYPCQGVSPCRTWPGGTPPQLIDGVLDTPRSVCLLRSRRRTFLFQRLFSENIKVCSVDVPSYELAGTPTRRP